MSSQNKEPGFHVPSAVVEYWRQYESTLKELERAAERDPARFATKLLGYVATLQQEQQRYQDYLRHRFGIEYHIIRIRAGCRFRMTRTVTDPKRSPRTRRERVLCEAARLEIVSIETSFRELLVAVDHAERSGADVDRAICEAFLRDFRLIPAFYGVAAQVVQQPAVQESCVQALSAWVASQIALRSPYSLDHPTRTAKALNDEGTGLLEALPPATITCFADIKESGLPLRRPGGRKESLVSRVESHLAAQGHVATVNPGWFVDEALNEQIAVTEQFSAREEASRQANELIEQAGLSPNEESNLRLRFAGYTKREIAERRGVTEGTVKREDHRALEKLRKTAEQ